jgi:segregation and condensation protein A
MTQTTPPTSDDAQPAPQPGASTDAVSSEDAPSGYEVRVGTFAGPLDLLLHLVRANEVEISDIPIIEITKQYNEHLELMRELNLEIAGEFLVMAATLMHIKSQMLLPPEPGDEEEEAEDPRAELAQQLLEYQRFKQAAENLQAMESRRTLIWTRDDVPADFEGEELLAVEMFDLLKAFRKLLSRLGEEARVRLKRDTVSVAEKMEWLTGLLSERRSMDFVELMEDLPTRLDCIATFLAVLELMRMQHVVAFQRKLFGDIRIALTPEGKRGHDGAAVEAATEGDDDGGSGEETAEKSTAAAESADAEEDSTEEDDSEEGEEPR